MARPLRRNHADRDGLIRLDETEVNIESVAEEDRVARLQVGCNILGKNLRLRGIRSKQHDDVGPLSGLSVAHDLEASFFRLHSGCGVLAQADNNLHAGVAQVLRMRMALRAITNDGNFSILDNGQVSVGFVKSLDCHFFNSLL